MEKLQTYVKNKISLTDLRMLFHLEEYLDLVELVKHLMNERMIEPIKNSGLNGKTPALYNSYRILRTKQDYSAEKAELLCLSSYLKVDYYMNHIEKYLEDRSFIILLDTFFKKNLDSLNHSVSMNERSFEIFGREKFIGKESGLRILKNLGLTIEQLNIYPTTEPLAYYTNHKKQPQNLLIIENKDTFYSMRKHLIDGNPKILGVEIGTLIYGGGKAIYRSFEDFDLCVEPYMNCTFNTYLYFGDLDYEGILIYETLQSMVGEKKIIPFVAAYETMLYKSGNLKNPKTGIRTQTSFDLPEMKSGQNSNCGERFFSYFAPEIQTTMMKILQDNRYIPQEILQQRDFK